MRVSLRVSGVFVLEGENVTLSALSTGQHEHETSRPHVCTTLGLPDD